MNGIGLNGIAMNGIGLNGIGFNGEVVNQFTNPHPGWIDLSSTQATLNHQKIELIGLEDGRLGFRVHE